MSNTQNEQIVQTQLKNNCVAETKEEVFTTQEETKKLIQGLIWLKAGEFFSSDVFFALCKNVIPEMCKLVAYHQMSHTPKGRELINKEIDKVNSQYQIDNNNVTKTKLQ